MVCGLSDQALDAFLLAALREDAPDGDRTTEALRISGRGRGSVLAKEALVVCGLPAALRTFRLADPACATQALAEEGARVPEGSVVARVEGPLAALLMAERVALNLLQRISGIATFTRACVDEVAGTPIRLLDTRKTTPGMRALEKYAVRTGGGTNHRMGLSDGILIKDNHVAAVGSIGEAVRRARANAGHLLKVEVEVTSLLQLQEAAAAGADLILLDNMSDEELAEAARVRPPGVLLEASGGMRPGRLRAVAETGVDFISAGALTHSARAVDLSLEIEPAP
ncbi:MAG: carboxylating nicotinate-nucleotide diphosphorylase [Acidobacteriota bacterium]